MVTGQIGEIGPNGKALLGWDNYGYLTLGGVIINSRRESEVKTIAGKRCIDVHDKLADNKLFSELIEVLGLVPGIDYTNKRDRDTL
ncbi:hypothetical protein, partial [Listeria monocytogenes]|uniref:hypothetical protein n=1 Tax=Listeria monocytogenes TaxID=1639 RepID=UPI002FDC38AC